MKKIGRMFTLMMAIVILLSTFTCAFAADTGIDVSIEKVGTIDENIMDASNLSYAGLVERTENDTYIIRNWLGEDTTGEEYDDFTNCYLDKYVLVMQMNDTPNAYGLISLDGEVVIPCEAAIISPVGNRYLEVSYATEEVESEEDAYMYASSALFSLMPDEDDPLYAGYSRIFDLETLTFVDGVETSNPGDEFYEIDGALAHFIWDDMNYTVYTRSGEIKEEFTGGTIGDYFTVTERHEDQVYCEILDGDMNVVQTLDFKPDRIFGEVEAFAVYGDSETVEDEYCYTLVDADGNKLVDIEFDRLSELGDKYVYGYELGNEKYGIFALDGTEIYPFEAEYADELEYGFLQIELEDEELLIYPDGTISEGFDDINWLVMTQEKNDKDQVYVLEDEKFSLKLNSVNWFGDYTFCVTDWKDGAYALYSIVDGEKLLDYEYEEILYEGGYIYAETEDGDWEVYELMLTTTEEE